MTNVNQEAIEPQLSPAAVQQRSVSRRPRAWWLGIGMGILMLGGGIWSLDLDFSGPLPGSPVQQGTLPAASAPVVKKPAPLQISAKPPAPQPETAPVFRPEQIEGHWVRNGTIRRDIVISPGGKATLNVQLDYLSALLYGREMNMELSWTLKDGILTHTILSGTPKANVARLIHDFGDSLSYKVIKADQTELVLEDLDESHEQHHWIAVKNSSKLTEN